MSMDSNQHSVIASSIALGNFDGVHVGHRRILETLRAYATRNHLRPLALTFDPHPRHFFVPTTKPALLTPPREKAALIADLGVELVTLAFDSTLAALSAEDFVREILCGKLGGKAFFLGPDHRFGRGALGSAALLRTLLGNDAVQEIPLVASSDADSGEIISSSAIRSLLESGLPADLLKAGRMLGRPYALGGTVVRGRERGRQLGFPTANLSLEDARKILPRYGVYGGFAHFEWNGQKTRVSAVANIGMRPTFSEPEPAVEIHIPGWEGDLYGKFVDFELAYPLRPEMKFDSVDALRAQIRQDIENWKSIENQTF